jgi:hypothetical protein
MTPSSRVLEKKYEDYYEEFQFWTVTTFNLLKKGIIFCFIVRNIEDGFIFELVRKYKKINEYKYLVCFTNTVFPLVSSFAYQIIIIF